MVEQSAVNRLVVGSSPTWGVFTKRLKMTEYTDKLKIGNKYFSSRLMLGTGKYQNKELAINSIKKSQCDILSSLICHSGMP